MTKLRGFNNIALNKQGKLTERSLMKGKFRVHVKEQDRVVGDSGWVHNTLCDTGMQHYILDLLGAGANSKQVKRATLGSGGSPATNATALPNEISQVTGKIRKTTVYASTTSAGTPYVSRFTCTWASSDSFVTVSTTIGNVALLNDVSNQTTAATIFCGNTYTASTLQINQDVNLTYDVTFTAT